MVKFKFHNLLNNWLNMKFEFTMKKLKNTDHLNELVQSTLVQAQCP